MEGKMDNKMIKKLLKNHWTYLIATSGVISVVLIINNVGVFSLFPSTYMIIVYSMLSK